MSLGLRLGYVQTLPIYTRQQLSAEVLIYIDTLEAASLEDVTEEAKWKGKAMKS